MHTTFIIYANVVLLFYVHTVASMMIARKRPHFSLKNINHKRHESLTSLRFVCLTWLNVCGSSDLFLRKADWGIRLNMISCPRFHIFVFLHWCSSWWTPWPVQGDEFSGLDSLVVAEPAADGQSELWSEANSARLLARRSPVASVAT